MNVLCCHPLSLLQVNGSRLVAIKLGQSLRSAGSRRKRQCFQKADSDSDSTHRLDSRKEHRVEGCAETEKRALDLTAKLAAL